MYSLISSTRSVSRVSGLNTYAARRLTPTIVRASPRNTSSGVSSPYTKLAGFSRRTPYLASNLSETYLPLLPLARLYSTNPPSSTANKEPSSSSSDLSSKEIAKTSDSSKDVKPQLTTWEKVKKEAKHYWHGTKLLGQEVKISSKLQWKVLNGGTLTRRETRQLKRTTTDLLRLIPFSVFVIIPGLELLLPVFLKFFPNMLPSTFEDKYAAEEKQRKLLRVRIGMAKFLQETISESGLKANDVVKSDEFKQFFRKVRSTGESPSKEDIIKVAKLFESDVTLDNLSRPQLVSMSRYMKIHAFGTDNFLRHQIRNRLQKIRRDDKVILAEGIQSLSVSELQMACQSRGIRFTGVSPSALRRELESWIELHYTNKVSGVLLVLSRAFHFNEEHADVIKSLEVTLSSLPDNLLSEAELEVLGGDATYQEKLEVLQQQQELIEEEAEQEQEEETARKEKKDQDDRIRAEEKARKEEERARQEKMHSDALALLPESELKTEPESAQAEESVEADGRMTREQLHELAEALTVLSARSSIVKERQELKQLMEENIASEEGSKLRPEDHDEIDTSLSKRIRSMLNKIDIQLEAYDSKVGGSLKMIEVDGQGKISLADLEKALLVIKHRPEQEEVQTILEKLDSDHDGFVVLEDVIDLTQDQGLGIVVDDKVQKILAKGADLKDSSDELKLKKSDILKDE
ncbi:Ca2-binding transmembrane protein LETM1/MRS7 [Phaffia rhodozyma]|uniref:Mitochondrial proton/calcium exchanger protein n=1 Tax=Phaffia rhodozyma TaxID=264483 RepID=A0A0F7SFT0_PHARH|nr:Ca2-binding transmembrane protein LETM1/MRS7 [Phaffia rhodozyma]